MKLILIRFFNKLLIVPTLLFFTASGFADTVTVPTGELQHINFKIINDEKAYTINMYLTKSKNLLIDYTDSKLITMAIQDQMQKKYSADLVLRLKDASSGGCYVSIQGDLPKNTATITVDSSQFTKCNLTRTYYSSNSWTLYADITMN